MLRHKLLLRCGELSEAQCRIREFEGERHGILKDVVVAKEAEDARYQAITALGDCFVVSLLMHSKALRRRKTDFC